MSSDIVQVAFQVRVAPHDCQKSGETIGRMDRIDPLVSNDQIEWRTFAAEHNVCITALLIQILPEKPLQQTASQLPAPSMIPTHVAGYQSHAFTATAAATQVAPTYHPTYHPHVTSHPHATTSHPHVTTSHPHVTTYHPSTMYQ